ncbi:hypothetical protein HHK36_019624 [Tetracentron sinense]|uniref:Ku C-terminal domain-containing protein n=1 Tax=Tetracentron sinense TaxID=13715 RepID=A0A835DCX6_TETSI|nr:hypothetical protein HHK36_019624 [Tetracentron sinense]
MRERERDGAADIGDVQTINSIENASIAKVVKIGDLTPIQDFEAMISHRDSMKRVNKAIRDMKNVIFDLVENSYEGYTYQKALESLVALHKGYILEQGVDFCPVMEYYIEDERQAISRYRMGLKMEIKKELTTVRLTSFEEAYQLALKIEAQLRHSTLKRTGVVVGGFSTSQNTSSVPRSNVSTSN